MAQKTNYDDIAMVMAAVISCIAILGLVLFLKGGLTGNSAKTTEGYLLEITQPSYHGSETFYCDNKAFALWTPSTINAVLKLDYQCIPSDINKDVTCCTPPNE